MSQVLNFIQSNNLDLVAWFNADLINLQISPTLFRWNSLGTVSGWTLTQTNPNLFPDVSGEGITFNSGSLLSTSGTSVLPSTKYTVLAVSKDNGEATQSLLTFNKTNLNNFVSYGRVGLSILQTLQPALYSSSIQASTDLVSEVNGYAISHDIKRGDTRFFASPSFTAEELRSFERYYKVADGRLVVGGGQLTNLYHLLILDGLIDAVTLEQIYNLLLLTTPVLNDAIYWDSISTEIWDNLSDSLWNTIL